MSYNPTTAEINKKRIMTDVSYEDAEYEDMLARREAFMSKSMDQVHSEYIFEKHTRVTTDAMPTDAAITGSAEVTAPKLGFRDRKKEKERVEKLEKMNKKAAEATRVLDELLATRSELIEDHFIEHMGNTISEPLLEVEDKLLEAKLKAIDIAQEKDLLDKTLSEERKREIDYDFAVERAKAYRDYAEMLPVGSKEREKAMKEHEKMEVIADKKKRLMKLDRLEGQEKEIETNTYNRHKKYEWLSENVFRKDKVCEYSKTGATLTGPDGHLLFNKGRIFLGGTKPMYLFEDEITGKEFLFKEARNCVGQKETGGTMMTVIGAKFQRLVCGKDSSIAAFEVRDSKGEIVGSMQEKIRKDESEGVTDLYTWQKQEVKTELPPETKRDIMREHALDWLLCNFDTKGENFMVSADTGRLLSYDKEAGYKHFDKEASREMDYQFKPHSNDTLYNTLFKEFVAGRTTLDFGAFEEVISKVMDVPEFRDREKYLANFEAFIDHKYGEKEKEGVREDIWQRVNQLTATYHRFFLKMILDRKANLEAQGKTLEPEYAKLIPAYDPRNEIDNVEYVSDVLHRADLIEERISDIQNKLSAEQLRSAHWHMLIPSYMRLDADEAAEAVVVKRTHATEVAMESTWRSESFLVGATLIPGVGTDDFVTMAKIHKQILSDPSVRADYGLDGEEDFAQFKTFMEKYEDISVRANTFDVRLAAATSSRDRFGGIADDANPMVKSFCAQARADLDRYVKKLEAEKSAFMTGEVNTVYEAFRELRAKVNMFYYPEHREVMRDTVLPEIEKRKSSLIKTKVAGFDVYDSRFLEDIAGRKELADGVTPEEVQAQIDIINEQFPVYSTYVSMTSLGEDEDAREKDPMWQAVKHKKAFFQYDIFNLQVLAMDKIVAASKKLDGMLK